MSTEIYEMIKPKYLFASSHVDVKTHFKVKEERENDWMSLMCSYMHKFKGRLDWTFICYSIKFY